MTGEEKFLDASLKTFEFIQDRFVDDKLGGWFSILDFDARKPLNPYKLNDGICPYHNGRMNFEIIERFRRYNK